MRPRVAFFDDPAVFEDFYPHYGVDQRAFATTWVGAANQAVLEVVQREVGDVRWYSVALNRGADGPTRHALGFEIQFVRSAVGHRLLWRTYYEGGINRRWPSLYEWYATAAEYVAPLTPNVYRPLRAFRPDLLFAQNYKTGKFDVLLAMARKLDVPFVARHSGGPPDGYHGTVIRRRTLPRADMLLASSLGERDLLIDRFGVPPENIRVILNPIDTGVFRPVPGGEAGKAEEFEHGDRPRFLYVGRLSPEKGVEPLIEAFARVINGTHDAELVIVGAGRLGGQLRARAAELAPDRIRFLGWASGRQTLARLYSSADCLVLPSRWEGAAAVVAESLACGTPVLATRVGATPVLVVEGETGWLYESGDVGALEERLRHVIDHPDEVAAMREGARRLAEQRVSSNVVGAELREALQEVLSG